ncbi:ATP-dependent helicase HrpB [Saccharospirillum salsuginis]|uniref:ATP-dependent helicase HrpB n=1 Tax=Saccharospirillum salsuginis TaxID=418750 RepID=A0A918NDD3_9GAMM|nr:ATP-dependent helicase HrpB [Saccharospirillum salsuginis]GGX64355.1 ATP-dependent helicase HrpB [Saccharospirillum salsuginis]
MTPHLPVDAIREPVLSHWRNRGCLVQSPPGSGKTTRIPLWLLEASEQEVVLLLPRRLPVKLAAKRLAEQRGEPVGQSVGYRLRDDNQAGPRTRLTVTTYGSFIRRLQNDPGLEGVGTVILDEFHERQLDQDTCLTLLHACRDLFRDDLKLLVMSATLTLDTLQKALDLPRVESDGELHPLAFRYHPVDDKRWPVELARLLSQVRQERDGHQLVFLPGLREIEQTARALSDSVPNCVVHSQVPQDDLYERLESAGPTVILSTNIAESSVTLPGVRTVIDLGLERYPVINPLTGLTELKTRRISKSSATQRAGRAARLGPGLCYRLWSESAHDALAPDQPPEITQADLTPLVLTLNAWGLDRHDAFWLSAPTAGRWQAAHERLRDWGALDNQGRLTGHGQQLDTLGVEPALAHLALVGRRHDRGSDAVWLAACLARGEPLTDEPSNLTETVQQAHPALKREAGRLARRLGITLDGRVRPLPDAVLVEALPHWLIRIEPTGRARMNTGREVRFATRPPSSAWALLLHGRDKGSSIQADVAWPLDEQTVQTRLPERTRVVFDPAYRHSGFAEQRWLGPFLMSEQPSRPDSDTRQSAWLDWLARTPLDHWPNVDRALGWLERYRLLRRLDPEWPNLPDSESLSELAEPYLGSLERLDALDTLAILQAWLGYDACRRLDDLCPTRWEAPSGRHCELVYDAVHDRVSAALKLQEAFGLADTPKLAGGRQAITLDLQAPNGRTLARVTDLPHFWRSVYPQVRKEMRGRYNKHPWPEDPMTAAATRATNRQLRRTQDLS